MIWLKWGFFDLGAAIFLAGLVLGLITILKKKPLPWKIFPLAGAAVGLILALVFGLQLLQSSQQVKQNNYVACRLLELDDYSAAQQSAESAMAFRKNKDSAQLILLSLLFQERYTVSADAAAKYADQFDEETFVQYIQLSQDGEAGKSIRTTLTVLRNQIKEGLRLGKSAKTRAEGIVNALHGLAIGEWSAEMELLLDELSESSDPLSLKTAAQMYIRNGDPSTAFQLMEEAASKEDSFPAKASLAAMAAQGYANTGTAMDTTDPEQEKLLQEQEKRYNEMQELQAKLRLEDNQNKIRSLNKQIERLEQEIESLRLEQQRIPVRRALNYIEASKPGSADELAYRLMLSILYYRMGETTLAEDQLTEIFTGLDKANPSGFLWTQLRHLMQAYEDSMNLYNRDGLSDQQLQNASTQTAVDELLRTVDYSLIYNQLYPLTSAEEFDEQQPLSYRSFILEVLAQVRSGVSISGIDASNYPEIALQVNISRKKEDGYQKQDFALFQSGVTITDFTVEENGTGENQSMSNVCIVVDHSGSMDGQRMVSAKQAVNSFIQTQSGSARMGLVVFDDSADLLCPITESTGMIQRQVDTLTADGGTYIASGLRTAMEALSGCSGERIIILLSDGEDGGSADEMESVIAQLASQGIAVYAIGIAGADSAYLNNICTKTGGQFLRAESEAALVASYQTIGRFLTGGYTFRFVMDTTDDPYKLKVRLVVDDGVYDEDTFTLGVSLEDILAEQLLPPRSNYFQETGGSMKGEIAP